MTIDTAKVKNWLLAILVFVAVGLAAFSAHTFYDLQDERVKLSALDAEIQQLDIELGLSKSRLLTTEELNSKYKQDISDFPERLQEIVKEYDLKIKSKDTAIARLRNTVTGGTTTVVVSENTETETPTQVISYEWEEELGRFKLKDPDIFTPDNEVFTSEQYMRVVGHVLFGKDGQLQIRKVELHEVIPNGVDEDGNPIYKLIPNSKVELVDSNFEYTNNLPVRKKGFMDIFTLRILASVDTSSRFNVLNSSQNVPNILVSPGLGIEILNLGRLIDYANIGINARLNPDFSDPLGGSLPRSRITVGAHYHIIPPLLNTNLAVGISIGLPFDDLSSPILSVDAIFFLTDDLNPFISKR